VRRIRQRTDGQQDSNSAQVYDGNDGNDVYKKAKKSGKAGQNSTPPIEKNLASGSRPAAPIRYSTQRFFFCNNFFYLCINVNELKHIAMKVKGISNSIYGGYAGADGLTMKNGRLINNRPTSETGIAEMARARKMAKYEEKVNMIAEGYSRGEMISEASEMMMMPIKIRR